MHTIWTVGHGTRTVNELVDILKGAGVKYLVDVRSYPMSRTNPQFNSKPLGEALKTAHIGYRWMGELLGGRRPARKADKERHSSLEGPGFIGYAAWMETPSFRRGVRALLRLATRHPVAYMCSETLWFRCHRRMISDYLVKIHGWKVFHLGMGKVPKRHVPWELCRKRRGGDALVYDKESDSD
jgi:uncharacterized protein (DUF488 family)